MRLPVNSACISWVRQRACRLMVIVTAYPRCCAFAGYATIGSECVCEGYLTSAPGREGKHISTYIKRSFWILQLLYGVQTCSKEYSQWVLFDISVVSLRERWDQMETKWRDLLDVHSLSWVSPKCLHLQSRARDLRINPISHQILMLFTLNE